MPGNRINMKNVVLFIKSATELVTNPSPVPPILKYTIVQFGEGNLTWTINDAPIEYMPDRGLLDDVTSGDEAPLDLSFEGKFSRIVRPAGDPEPLTIAEMVKGYKYGETDHGQMALAGLREPWLVFDSAGTNQISCPPYACELEFHNNPKLECGPINGLLGEAHLFRYFRADTVGVDIRAGQISISGKCHIIIPMVKAAYEFAYSDIANAVPLNATDPWAKDPRSPFTS